MVVDTYKLPRTSMCGLSARCKRVKLNGVTEPQVLAGRLGREAHRST